MVRKMLALALGATISLMLVPGEAGSQQGSSTSVSLGKAVGKGPGGPVFKVLIYGHVKSPDPACKSEAPVRLQAGRRTFTDITDKEGEFSFAFRSRKGIKKVQAFYPGRPQGPSTGGGYSGGYYGATQPGPPACAPGASRVIEVRAPGPPGNNRGGNDNNG